MGRPTGGVNHRATAFAVAAAALLVAAAGVAGAGAGVGAVGAPSASAAAGDARTGVGAGSTATALAPGQSLADITDLIQRIDSILETLLDLVRTANQLFGAGVEGEGGD